MLEDVEIDNIVHAGLVFIVYLFVAILVYYLLSSPVDTLLNMFLNSSVGTSAEIAMSTNIPLIKTALNIAFALGIAFPIVWFIMWVFSKEPDFSMFRR